MSEPRHRTNLLTSFFSSRSNLVLFLILVLGFALRMIFTLFLADKVHYNHSTFVFPDTVSFTQSFINYWESGKYSHDLTNPEAAFGRLPGYPAFFGIHYVIFGKQYALQATAFTQIILDVISIWLIYKIVYKISGHTGISLLAAFIYSTYPFIIYWVPYICTESVGCFITLLWVYIHLHTNKKNLQYFFLGLICSVALFIRAYLGILVVLSLIILLVEYRTSLVKYIKVSTFLVLGFLTIYISWPIRNYYNFEKIVLLRPASAGYANYSNDMVGYTLFYHCWSQDDNAWYDSLFIGSNDIFPEYAFSSEADRALGRELLHKLRTCGSSYPVWMNKTVHVSEKNCNAEIYRDFVYLRDKFIDKDPYMYLITIPMRNLKKAFFKVSPEKKGKVNGYVYYVYFSYRSALIILGFAGIFFLRKYPALLTPLIFSTFMYLYICFYYRSLEMRYILQADVLLLIPAAITVYEIYLRFIRRRLGQYAK